jgi:predicted enzyme related to lactoylglutathione lyase
MELTNTRGILQVHDADLTDSRFSVAKLTNVHFDDVNLQGSTFKKANLANARFNLTGMSINGALVTDLIRVFGRRARMVLYAKDRAILQAFYQGVFQLEVEQSELDHVVLGSSALQLVIVQVPESIASTIHLVDPPVRRTQTPVKLVFDVESISAARGAVLNLGGGIDPTASEWIFQGHRVCDGHDPEGNVVQFQQRHRNSGTRVGSGE